MATKRKKNIFEIHFEFLYFDPRWINDCLILFATVNEMSLAGGGGGIGGDK
jgi:hypothetical protein